VCMRVSMCVCVCVCVCVCACVRCVLHVLVKQVKPSFVLRVEKTADEVLAAVLGTPAKHLQTSNLHRCDCLRARGRIVIKGKMFASVDNTTSAPLTDEHVCAELHIVLHGCT
jgi:hypothetical protein